MYDKSFSFETDGFFDLFCHFLMESFAADQQIKQAISAPERTLCQLTLFLELQTTSESTKGHKSCALQMVLGSNVQI